MQIVRPRPSWRQGFARGPSEAAYPTLWDGLVLALPVSFGPTGDDHKLFDMSQYGLQDATLVDTTGAVNWEFHDDAGTAVSQGTRWSIQLAATSDRGECPINAITEVQQHTFAAWVLSKHAQQRMIGGKCDNVASSGVEWGQTNPRRIGIAYNDGGIRGWYQTNGNVIAADTWHFICICWEPGTALFFVDGNFITSVATTSGTISYSNDRFDFGGASTNASWEGNLSDMYLYNRVLNHREIHDLWLHGPFERRLIFPSFAAGEEAVGGSLPAGSLALMGVGI